MRGTLRVLFVSFVAAIGVSEAAAQQDVVGARHVALIAAEPVSIELKRRLGGADQAGNLIFGNVYTVSFRSVRVIHGELREGADALTLELTATQRDSIPIGREIFVLVSASAAAMPQALYWGVPQRVACIPDDLAVGTGLGRNFNGFARYDGSRCTSID